MFNIFPSVKYLSKAKLNRKGLGCAIEHPGGGALSTAAFQKRASKLHCFIFKHTNTLVH